MDESMRLFMSFLKQKYIGTNYVTNVKLAQIANKRIKGRLSAGTGDVEDISLRDLLLEVNNYYLIAQNDFESGVISPWSTANSGIGAAVTAVTPTDKLSVGVVQCSTGSNSTGYSGIHFTAGVSMFIASGGELISITKLMIPTLSTATQRFGLRVGFGDSITSADHTDSCGYFEYTDNVNSGQWVIATANNGTRTKTNSTVTVPANAWIYLKTVTNSAGTLTEFYVNNTLVGSISTNIPNTLARAFGYTCFIIKSVGILTSLTVLVDRCFIAKERIDVGNY